MEKEEKTDACDTHCSSLPWNSWACLETLENIFMYSILQYSKILDCILKTLNYEFFFHDTALNAK